MSQYYFTDGKERYGPFTLEQLGEKGINPETLVWKEGLVDWVPARNLSELQSLLSASSAYPPPVILPYPTGMAYEAPPKNWLIESILITILCCLPLGIVGIIHATKVDTLWKTGQKEEAYSASREAGKWVKIGFFIGLAVIALYILFMILGLISGISGGLEV